MNQTPLTLLIGILATTAAACGSNESRSSSPSEWRDTETTAPKRRDQAAKSLPEPKEKGDAAQPKSPPCKDDVPMGTDPAPLTADETRIVAEALPLSLDTLDFNQIAKFFKLYRHIVETHEDPGKCAVIKQIDLAMISMNIVTDKITKSKQSTFSLKVGADGVVRWLNDPYGSYASFVEHLLVVNQAAFDLVSSFQNAYGKKAAPLNADQRELIAQQTPIYQSNQRALARWKSDTERVVGFKKDR